VDEDGWIDDVEPESAAEQAGLPNGSHLLAPGTGRLVLMSGAKTSYWPNDVLLANDMLYLRASATSATLHAWPATVPNKFVLHPVGPVESIWDPTTAIRPPWAFGAAVFVAASVWTFVLAHKKGLTSIIATNESAEAAILWPVIAAAVVLPIWTHAAVSNIVNALGSFPPLTYAAAAVISTGAAHVLFVRVAIRSARRWAARDFETRPKLWPVWLAACVPGALLVVPPLAVIAVSMMTMSLLKRWARHAMSADAP
jgi:hypothetical protein